MTDKAALRKLIRDNFDSLTSHINKALRGKNIQKMKPVLARIGRGGEVPHWYDQLKKNGTLPNLDGKTIGSVVEMLLVGVLECSNFAKRKFPEQDINPARGIDLPGLDLGVKSPSQNYCTSEPFFSAYERLLGSENDIVVLITDYQEAKKTPPLRLQIIKWRYLTKTEIADKNLCTIARNHRSWLIGENESWAKKLFRFLAYVNQSDWRAKQLIKLAKVMQDPEEVEKGIKEAVVDFTKKNIQAALEDRTLIPEYELKCLKRISTINPIHAGLIDALDNWVLDTLKDVGRAPSDNEWNRLKKSPLNGKIGMSFALQWRYAFSGLFS